MKTLTAPRIWTDEELLALPRGQGRCELIDGKLRKKVSPPKINHGIVAGLIASALNNHVLPKRAGFVMMESGCRLDPMNVLGPDVSFVSTDRLRSQGPDVLERYLQGAPDLVVEVISPSERKAKIRTKLGKYFADGARLVWHVYPARKVVEVYTAPDEMILKRAAANDELDGGAVLPDFHLPLAQVFLDWFPGQP